MGSVQPNPHHLQTYLKAKGAKALKIFMHSYRLAPRQELPTSVAQLGGKSQNISLEPSWDNTVGSSPRAPWERRPCAPWPGWAWSPQRRGRRLGEGRWRWGWRGRWRRRGGHSGWPLSRDLAGQGEADAMDCKREQHRIFSQTHTFCLYLSKNPCNISMYTIS